MVNNIFRKNDSGLSVLKCKQASSGFELRPLSPFPTMITITPRAPPKIL